MSRIVAQPCDLDGTPGINFKSTVDNKVHDLFIKDYFSDSEFSALKKICPDERLRIWGVTANNKSRWEKISYGDVVLFSDGTEGIFAVAKITYKIHNQELANKLWDPHPTYGSFKFLYFLNDFKYYDLPISGSDSYNHYYPTERSKGFFQRFNVWNNEDKSQILINKIYNKSFNSLSIRGNIKNVFNNYLTDVNTFNADENRPRSKSDYTSAESLVKTIPNQINKFIDKDLYFCKGSAGEGVFAEIPWIGIFDKEITNSAQSGYYIVYLFDSKIKKIYLCLALGWTQYTKGYVPEHIVASQEHSHKISNPQSRIRTHRRYLRDLISTHKNFSDEGINLNTSKLLGKGYELGNIVSKRYYSNGLPSDADLANDLKNLINLYRELKELIGPNIDRLDSIPSNLYYKKELREHLESFKSKSVSSSVPEIEPESASQASERKKASITGDKGESIFLDNAYAFWGWENLIDKTDSQNLGYDFLCEDPELYIEVKGCLDGPCAIRLTEKEWELAKEKRDKYILVIVFQIDDKYDDADMLKIEDPYDKFNEDDIEERVVQVKSLHISRNAIRSVI
jgi:hypothetical protein